MSFFARRTGESPRSEVGRDFVEPTRSLDASSLDAAILAVLESHEREIGPRFWVNTMTFKDRDIAREAQQELAYRGWPQRASIFHAVSDDAWTLAAWSDSIIAAPLLRDSRAYLEMVARRFGGTFNGWSGSYELTGYDEATEFGNYGGRTLGWLSTGDADFLKAAREDARKMWRVETLEDLAEEVAGAHRAAVSRRLWGKPDADRVMSGAGVLVGDYIANKTGAVWVCYTNAEARFLCLIEPDSGELVWPIEIVGDVWEAGGEGLGREVEGALHRLRGGA